jgi:hypothetical protein
MGAEPNDVREMERLCRVVAKRMVADERKQQERRAKYHVGLIEEPDAHAPLESERQFDPVDQQRLLDILWGCIDAATNPGTALAILDGIAAGETYATIGAELELTERAVRYQLAAVREKFRARVVAAGLRELLPRRLRRARD